MLIIRELRFWKVEIYFIFSAGDLWQNWKWSMPIKGACHGCDTVWNSSGSPRTSSESYCAHPESVQCATIMAPSGSAQRHHHTLHCRDTSNGLFYSVFRLIKYSFVMLICKHVLSDSRSVPDFWAFLCSGHVAWNYFPCRLREISCFN